MLWDAERHEPVTDCAWDESRARSAIERIVALTEAAYAPDAWWPMHPQDAKDAAPTYLLYYGASGVVWALHHLQQRGAVRLRHDYTQRMDELVELNRRQLEDPVHFPSFLMGDTPIRMMQFAAQPTEALAQEIARLIEANKHNPTREYMWGSPGTMAAALFMFRRTGDERFARLYRETAAVLASQLEDSPEHRCRFWSQDMYGEHSSYIDAVHGLAGTAPPLLAGFDLLTAAERAMWLETFETTVRATAERDGDLANWRAWLTSPAGGRKLVQYCHGAPGFVICLSGWPGDSLDDLLAAGAETTWRAGPLRKGSNLCHGTGGNGYAFLKMFRRTGNELWLHRARAFAMHGIAQFEQALAGHGRARFSLWTGDPGLAIYLLDCIEQRDGFPTVDTFFH